MLRNIAKARLRKVYSRTPRKHTAAPDCAMGRIGSTRHSHAVRDNGTMPVMNDEVPGEGDFDAGRRRGEFDDITWRILAVVATPGVFWCCNHR